MTLNGPLLVLAPAAQLASYSEWLTVEVALRYALTYPWSAEGWRDIRKQIPWLLAEWDRLRRAGWFN